MKALTIKQPWAELIVSGIKDIENRTWRTKFRGRVYVHAAQKPVPFNGMDNGMKFTQPQLKEVFKLVPAKSGRYPDVMSQYMNSAIIGEVDIVDCVLNHPSVWAEHMAYDTCPETGMHILRKGQKYTWNWVLANPVKYDKPIENVKGALSFWEYNSMS